MKRRRLIQALCVAVVLLVPQIAWASSYTADSIVKVSGATPFLGNCGLGGQTGKTTETVRSSRGLV